MTIIVPDNLAAFERGLTAQISPAGF